LNKTNGYGHDLLARLDKGRSISAARGRAAATIADLVSFALLARASEDAGPFAEA
jgi:hypothetical protein